MAAPRRPAASASSSLKRPAPPLSRQSSRQPLSTTSPNAVIQDTQNTQKTGKPLLTKSRSSSNAAAMPSIHSRTSSSASVASSKNNNNNNQAIPGSEHAGNDAGTHSNGRSDNETSQGNIKVVVRCRQVRAADSHVTSIACLGR